MNVCVCAFALFLLPSFHLLNCYCKWRVALPAAAACHSLLQQIIADFCAQIFTAKSGDDWAEWQLLPLPLPSCCCCVGVLRLSLLLRQRERETKGYASNGSDNNLSQRQAQQDTQHTQSTHNATLARRQVSQHTHTHTHMSESGSPPLPLALWPLNKSRAC